MRNIILTTIFALLSTIVSAQVQVTDFDMVREGEQATVSFNAKVAPDIVKRNYKLTLTPRIVNGEDCERLSPILILGRRRRIMDERNRVSPVPGSYIVTDEQTVIYRSVVPYADWMEGANFSLEVVSEGCCTRQTLAPCLISKAIAVRGAEQPADPNVVNVRDLVLNVERNRSLPQTVDTQTTSQTEPEELTIDFKVGSSQLDQYAQNNHQSLSKLVESLRSSENALSGTIDITGYASPEGGEKLNYELAEKRAVAVRDYILDNVSHLSESDFNIINGGENWEGLRKIVEHSTMPARQQVIDIIESTPPRIDYVNNTSRKKQLMDLDGGRVWNYMLANFFPKLRSAASVTIYKTEQAEQEEGRNTEIIDNAITLIDEHKTADALRLLMEVESDPRSWNPLGVCYMLESNNERAKFYFERAIGAGYTEAKSNLEQLSNQ